MGDNHFAVNFADSPTVADINARMDAINSTWYHPFRQPHAPPVPVTQHEAELAYHPLRKASPEAGMTILTDPTGWQVQVNGVWGPPGYLPDADIDDGGFGGYCYTFC